MEFIEIAEDKLLNIDNIVSVERRKGSFSITTTDGKQHLVEREKSTVIAALTRAGVSTPKQFWAG